MKRLKNLLVITLLFTFISTSAQQLFEFKKVETNITASFRAASVVNDNIAWVSGSQGTVGRTIDGGKTWRFTQVKGFEQAEFRSLYAFDAERALIANVGSPAFILLTSNGGQHWDTVYTSTHKDAFFDGIDFWNSKEGIIYGDPIEGKMLLLRTVDGGLSWKEVAQAPLLEAGEASFAASGTGIRCLNKKQVMICTGGVVSRLWISNDLGEHWKSISVPIVQGQSTTGIFSFAQNKKVLTIVGGDFQKEDLTTNHHFYSIDGGKNWMIPVSTIRGYRECVETISKNVLIAVGPSGVDATNNNGASWKGVSDEKGLHVLRRARKGSLMIAAGGKGQVFIVKRKVYYY